MKNTVLTCGLGHKPPDYALETLELGPRSAVLDTFEPKSVLTQLDLFLEHCEQLCVDKDTMTDINILGGNQGFLFTTPPHDSTGLEFY